MKTSRIALAALLALAAAACSGDVTAPEPAQLAPASASQSATAVEAEAADPAGTEEAPDGSGLVGSSGG